MDGALTAYRADLISRNANPYNADWPRLHLTSALLSKPVALLAATELKKWRDGLLGTMAAVDHQPAYRLRECRAGAGRAARQAHHRTGMLGKSDWPVCRMRKHARNVILSDDTVREFVAAAYRHR